MSDRTTIKTTIQQFVTLLKNNLTAEPPTSTNPLRRVAVGEAGNQEYPRPYLAVRLIRFGPVATVDDDRMFQVISELRLVTDVTAADPHDAILEKIGAVENYLDTILDTGVIEGAEGFDDREWKIEYPKASSGARVAVAVATQTFVVNVDRQLNQ